MTNDTTLEEGGKDMNETKNFTRDEFRCKCGCGLLCISQSTVNMLQVARNWKKKLFPEKESIRINCGCRCKKHNQKVRGVPNSSHVPQSVLSETYAVDIDYDSTLELIALVICLAIAGFRRFGICLKKSYIHTDNDETKVKDIWEY